PEARGIIKEIYRHSGRAHIIGITGSPGVGKSTLTDRIIHFLRQEGKTVGVAIMDHPSNPRHPTYWHSRAYGLFAANPFGIRDFTGDKTQNGNFEVKAGQGVRWRYRVVIHSGDTRSANIEALYKKFAAEK
ncbi:MAG: hypothetical protein E4H19_14525, partial [Chromatiales bacterium]